MGVTKAGSKVMMGMFQQSLLNSKEKKYQIKEKNKNVLLSDIFFFNY